MHPFYKEFIEHLQQADKEWCVDRIMLMLSTGGIDIATLYNDILTPALNGVELGSVDEGLKIWKEHERTAIVRTIIENCYSYVIKERRKGHGSSVGERVVIFCPTEELHEMGARMVADFFTLCGFEVTFIGANTPLSDILVGIGSIKPKYVALSVTNHYNLVAAGKAIESIVKLRKDMGLGFEIIVGGRAFERNKELVSQMGADMHLSSLEEISKIAGGNTDARA
jgi:MerR family transcriptional regulator, light-induced transcriptional regulator